MENKKSTNYTHRYLARVVIEAVTPLAVGTGEKDVMSDALIALDVNKLPYIPGTALAGVLRHILTKENRFDPEVIDNLFGFQAAQDGKGSDIIFSEAKIIGAQGKVVDGMNPDALFEDSLLRSYQDLPIRQHVRIGEKGTGENGGKFDGQVVFVGSRFCFEIEMVADGSRFDEFRDVLSKIFDVEFRVGGGTRDGFGKIKVVDLSVVDLDLHNEGDLEAYLSKSSSLDNEFWKNCGKVQKRVCLLPDKDNITVYRLTLQPELFYLFSSGTGDSEVDITPVREARVIWNERGGRMEKKNILIPGSSIKGSIAHRTAFHWNRRNGIYTDELVNNEERKRTNEAVSILFGTTGDLTVRGNVLFSDLYLSPSTPEKILNHVSIDRFTGGGKDGALFSEKVTYDADNSYYEIEISLDNDGVRRAADKILGEDANEEKLLMAKGAFEDALNDLCNGMLPLGGGVNRGHGVFSGKCKIINKR